MTRPATPIHPALPLARRLCALAVLGLICASTPGCDLAVLAAAPFEDRKVDRLADLPEGRVLVWVEDATRSPYGEAFGRQVAVAAGHFLSMEGRRAETDLVDLAGIDRLRRQRGAAFDTMPLDVIGRQLGADVLIAGTVRTLALDPRMTTARPAARVTVRVIDVATGERLFPRHVRADGGATGGRPLTESGHPIVVELPFQLSTGDDDRAPAAQARELADEAGRTLARLFYDWKRPTTGETVLNRHDQLRRGN